jgi:hypothetical protein
MQFIGTFAALLGFVVGVVLAGLSLLSCFDARKQLDVGARELVVSDAALLEAQVVMSAVATACSLGIALTSLWMLR